MLLPPRGFPSRDWSVAKVWPGRNSPKIVWKSPGFFDREPSSASELSCELKLCSAELDCELKLGRDLTPSGCWGTASSTWTQSQSCNSSSNKAVVKNHLKILCDRLLVGRRRLRLRLRSAGWRAEPQPSSTSLPCAALPALGNYISMMVLITLVPWSGGPPRLCSG